jgi:hypothetical protein
LQAEKLARKGIVFGASRPPRRALEAPGKSRQSTTRQKSEISARNALKTIDPWKLSRPELNGPQRRIARRMRRSLPTRTINPAERPARSATPPTGARKNRRGKFSGSQHIENNQSRKM